MCAQVLLPAAVDRRAVPARPPGAARGGRGRHRRPPAFLSPPVQVMIIPNESGLLPGPTSLPTAPPRQPWLSLAQPAPTAQPPGPAHPAGPRSRRRRRHRRQRSSRASTASRAQRQPCRRPFSRAAVSRAGTRQPQAAQAAGRRAASGACSAASVRSDPRRRSVLLLAFTHAPGAPGAGARRPPPPRMAR